MPRLLLVAGAAVILMAMTGCVDPSPPVTPSPTPSATPVFASEEEALAAAEAAYREYTEAEDGIAQDGGAGADRLAPLVTADWLDHEVTAFDRFQETGRRQVGSTTIVETSLQQLNDLGDGTAEVVVYVCVDFSATSFVDIAGNPVETNGPRRTTIQASFQAVERDHLLLSGSEPWSESSC